MLRRHVFGWLQMAALLVATIVGGGNPALAGLSSTPREAAWVTDGPVYAIAPGNGVTYIGGDFNYVGPCNGHGAPINATTGQVTAVFPKVNGDIESCAADGSGGWYIGEEFTQVGGLTRNSLAHILANGTVDAAWNPNPSDGDYTSIDALAVSGSTVYVGGQFTSIGGLKRNNIAALDIKTGAVTAWNPNANDTVCVLLISGTRVYAGGCFTSIGGKTRNRIAALDPTTGAARAWNPDANEDVYTLTVSGSTVYVGGFFTRIGGKARNYIAALDISTGAASAWNPNAGDGYSASVYALAVSGSTVYVGGWFTDIGGQARNGIAALDATTGVAQAWDPNAEGDSRYFEPEVEVYALAISGSTLYVGGDFSSIGGRPQRHIAALDTATGVSTLWNPNVGDCVDALAVSASTVYAGGRFTSIGGKTRNYLAALDSKTGVVTPWDPSPDGAYYYGDDDTCEEVTCIYALAVSGTTVYAAGAFNTIGGQERHNIAALDATSGKATPWNFDVVGTVKALAVLGSTVYAGGKFFSMGEPTRYHLAALNATTGIATDWNPDPSSDYVDDEDYTYIDALAVSGLKVYAGGYFNYIGGQPCSNLALLDAKTGMATDKNPNTNYDVYALAVSDSTLYAGGSFSVIDGQLRKYLAALNTKTGAVTAWNPNSNSAVSALAVSGSTVYVGGYFTSIGGKQRSAIAALDAATGAAMDWNPNAGDGYPASVDALAVFGSTVYIGGNFQSIGGRERPYFAQFDMEAGAEDWLRFE